ncbi:hypothetical protein [uncultured Streptococcus sp.]|uniref:hypothetical protein n=1 Tax=uncultured Streptococcus sp. TaxID=83427 RepID=UPI0027DC15B6|nr:hypothetical protein [uncultured Streptococcus sp.]
MTIKELLADNEFLRDENKRLTNEQEYYYSIVAKANLLDVIISEGYILQSTLDKCIDKLDEVDQIEIRNMGK